MQTKVLRAGDCVTPQESPPGKQGGAALLPRALPFAPLPSPGTEDRSVCTILPVEVFLGEQLLQSGSTDSACRRRVAQPAVMVVIVVVVDTEPNVQVYGCLYGHLQSFLLVIYIFSDYLADTPHVRIFTVGCENS